MAFIHHLASLALDMRTTKYVRIILIRLATILQNTDVSSIKREVPKSLDGEIRMGVQALGISETSQRQQGKPQGSLN